MPKSAVAKVARKIGVSPEYLESCPHWMQEGRGATEAEFTKWARHQHKRACKEYEAAFPITFLHGKCVHMTKMKKPCVSFFGHTGICETGVFHPERIKIMTWHDFHKAARRAGRKVKQVLGI